MLNDFDIGRLLLITFSTLLIFFLFFKKQQKIFYIVFGVSFFLYAGIGWCYSIVDFIYLFYYMCYLSVFLFTYNLFSDYFHKKAFKNFKLRIKKSFVHIYVYVFIAFLISFLHDLSLAKYFVLKAPDLSFFSETTKKSPLEIILSYISLIAFPFYLYSLELYVIKKRLILLFIALFLPLFFLYTINFYISRSALVLTFALLISAFFRIYPNQKNKLIFIIILLIPTIFLWLYNFTLIRSGGFVSNISILEVFEILTYQELSWPIYFNEITKYSETYFYDFASWLLTLPIPNFIKGSFFDFTPNFIFSQKITGLEPGDVLFNVLLMGPVNESIFYFQYFYFLLPVFSAFLFAILISFFKKIPDGNFLIIYIILFEIPHFNRAGFSSVAPFLINSFLFFSLYVIYFSRIKINNNQMGK